MKKGYIDITVVLDRSGSMSSIREDTMGGFNTFLKEQKEAEGETKFTLTQFDDRYEIVHDGLPVSDVPELTNKTFVPRGSTALLDAMGRTINTVGSRLDALEESEKPEKVIFVVITDGHENSSRGFARSEVFEMVKHQTDTYNWEFIYLGANQDAIAAGHNMGFSTRNSMSYSADSVGVDNTYKSLGRVVRTCRSGQAMRGFTHSERDNANKK